MYLYFLLGLGAAFAAVLGFRGQGSLFPDHPLIDSGVITIFLLLGIAGMVRFICEKVYGLTPKD